MLRPLAMVSMVILAGGADACEIVPVDLTPALLALDGAPQVLMSDRLHPDLGDPVRRYTLDFGDGIALVLEQEDCLFRTLRLALLSPGPKPDDAGLARMAAALALTDIWRGDFDAPDALAVLSSVVGSEPLAGHRPGDGALVLSINDRLTAPRDSSDAIVTFMSQEDHAAPFGNVLTLSLSTGGA